MRYLTTSHEEKMIYNIYMYVYVFVYSTSGVGNVGKEMDDDGLYGDLELAAKQADLDIVQEKLTQALSENSQLRTEVEQYRTQLVLLVEEKESLEKNCVSIFRTAMREIARKDDLIKELQTQLLQSRTTISNEK